jgi:hypothetical protein
MKDIGPLTILLALFCVGYGFGVPALHAEVAAPLPEVTATGGVSAPLIAKDEDLRFWITIQNKTPSDLSQIRLTQFPDGYQITEVCFFIPQPDPASKKQDKPCANPEQLADRDITMPLVIPAGQNLTVGGRLKPYNTHKKETLTLVLEWTVTSKPSSSVTVALGENQVQDNWHDWSSSWFYQLLKDLALPIVLLVFGTWLNLSTKRRDARSETLKLMLPVSHKYAAKYYLPLSRATERAGEALYDITETLAIVASPINIDLIKLESDRNRSLFYILLAKRLLDDMRKAIGGLYFKDLRGEFLASSCIRKFGDLLGEDKAPLAMELQRLSTMVQPMDTYETFETKFLGVSSPLTAEEAATASARELFQKWADDDEKRRRALELLSALTVILDFEANRPYGYWYDEMNKIDLVGLNKKDPTGAQGDEYVNVKRVLLGFADDIKKDKTLTEQEKKERVERKTREIERYLEGRPTQRFPWLKRGSA